MKESGIIIKKEKDSLVVETIPHKECKRCKTCGAGRSRKIVIDKKYEDLKKGDKVQIETDPSVMLKVYMLLYGAPLLIFIITILTSYSLLESPVLSSILGTGLTIIGYFFIGKHIKKKKEFSPKIKKLQQSLVDNKEDKI